MEPGAFGEVETDHSSGLNGQNAINRWTAPPLTATCGPAKLPALAPASALVVRLPLCGKGGAIGICGEDDCLVPSGEAGHPLYQPLR